MFHSPGLKAELKLKLSPVAYLAFAISALQKRVKKATLRFLAHWVSIKIADKIQKMPFVALLSISCLVCIASTLKQTKSYFYGQLDKLTDVGGSEDFSKANYVYYNFHTPFV